jgi:hypothetical protein
MKFEDTKELLLLLNSEYQGMLTNNKEVNNAKTNMWYMHLKEFSKEEVMKAVYTLTSKKVFGKPNISDLMDILKPQMQEQNMGAEFADRFILLQKSIGTENMGNAILQEFGEIGFQIYQNNKSFARMMTYEEVPTFKAQIRNTFNSMKERERVGDKVALPFKENQTIMNKLKELDLIGDVKNE